MIRDTSGDTTYNVPSGVPSEEVKILNKIDISTVGDIFRNDRRSIEIYRCAGPDRQNSHGMSRTADKIEFPIGEPSSSFRF
jgi:hypothetical protein